MNCVSNTYLSENMYQLHDNFTIKPINVKKSEYCCTVSLSLYISLIVLYYELEYISKSLYLHLESYTPT